MTKSYCASLRIMLSVFSAINGQKFSKFSEYSKLSNKYLKEKTDVFKFRALTHNVQEKHWKHRTRA